MNRQIILASSSLRRKELLQMIGLTCKIIAPQIDEKRNPRLKIRSQVEAISQKKAQAVAEQHPDAVIIAADTLVEIEGEILGKPTDRDDAVRMLHKLSGKTHSVCTGFTIIDTASKKQSTKSEETKVTMRKVTEHEIMQYIETDKPFDKAGGYAIQGIGAILFERIEGDYSNVVGLPITSVALELKRFKIDVL